MSHEFEEKPVWIGTGTPGGVKHNTVGQETLRSINFDKTSFVLEGRTVDAHLTMRIRNLHKELQDLCALRNQLSNDILAMETVDVIDLADTLEDFPF